MGRISVFKDDVSTQLLRSIIEGSKISIIIPSEHYASSRRCLEELTKIMEFRRAYDQVVLPIFHGVDRSEVRNQEYSFGKAFQGLIQRISPTEDEVSRWRTALSEVGGHYGVLVPYFNSNNQSEYTQHIVQCVRYILNTKGPFATDGLVGVRSQVQEVIKMLQDNKTKDVVSIGKLGRGKAQILYYKIFIQFSMKEQIR
ncbi:disease resistance protein RML1B-like [Neltuma alba]|uniref:disease resistance protein RML1B-like n=1 Tax=Neltuma alba TaxID=207710 RepID=UPI0010A2F17C|nr:disease resistance protein RML1B-like [Prosopis alba]